MAISPMEKAVNIQPSSGTVVERIRALLSTACHVQLISHVDPDGDAIGSLLGLGWLLRAQGKEVLLTCDDAVPEPYAWLPGSDEIRPPLATPSWPRDLLICLDCSDLLRMGQLAKSQAGELPVPLINIDHHVTNTRFGVVNLVEPGCVATAQLVLVLADALGWDLSPSSALCLLTGIVTDTRGLRTSNVDAPVLRAVLRLAEAGASLSEITRRTLDQRPLNVVRLWGEAIGRLRLEDGIVWTEVTREMLARWPSSQDGMTGLSNFLAGVQEANVIAVFVERDDGRTVDVGLRAAPGYDVSGAAVRLGGGGHPQASGCTLEGDLREVRERVLEEIRATISGQALRSRP